MKLLAKSLAKSLAPFVVAATLVGCGPLTEKSDPDFCEGTSCEQTLQPLVTGVFVSGHLGNYRDCPDDGYSPQSTDSSSEPAPGADADFAACHPDDQDCNDTLLNCEQAQLTVSLSNAGDAAATGLQADRVELYNLDGDKVADLPVIEVTESNAAYDGDLETQETLSLRIDFQGPQNPYQLLDTSSSSSDEGVRFGGGSAGTVRVIFSADNHDDVTVEGKELYAVPSVDT